MLDTTNGGAFPVSAGDTGKTDHLWFKLTNGDNRQWNSPTGTDGDNASATANYWMRIHAAAESVPSNKASHYVYRIATPNPVSGIDPLTGTNDLAMTNIDDPGYATYFNPSGSNGFGVNCNFNTPPWYWGLINGGTAVLSAIPGPGKLAGVWEVFFTMLNLRTTNQTPQPQKFFAQFTDAAWNDPWSDFPADHPKGGPYLKTDYHMVPKIRVRYLRKYGLVDNYGPNGFTGESLAAADQFIDVFNSFGHFVYAKQTPPSP